jgi:hypothetical protein
MALQWIDRKPVNMLTTFNQDSKMTPTGKTDRKTKTPIVKPKAVQDYNK